VLFDLDGTLVDTIDFILASVRHTFAERSHAPTDADWIAGIGTPLRAQLSAYAADAADLETLVERYRAHQRAHHDVRTRCFDGARETLEALRSGGHRVGVVTGKLAQPAARALRHVGLDDLVEVVVGADDCDRHKPHPAPVLQALARMAVSPRDALYVGDSPHDVAAGNAAGVTTVAVQWGACDAAALSAARPHHVIDTMDELHTIVRALASTPASG
jgi:pyrophosphatase PpaX